MSGASNARVSVSVANPVFRFSPARLTHAPVNRCVTGSKELPRKNQTSILNMAVTCAYLCRQVSARSLSPCDILSNWLIKWNNRCILPMDSAEKSCTRLLLCSRHGDALLAMQGEVFRASGYEVVATAFKEQIQEHIESTDFDVVILNHTLSFSDRKSLARKAMQHARTHHGPAADSKYVVVADLNRNYTFATDPVCELLGYDRAMLLELRIDDVVDGSTQVTAPLFQQFVADGRQAGRITLRHRSGKKVPVKYSSLVEPDGCVVAHWEPL